MGVVDSGLPTRMLEYKSVTLRIGRAYIHTYTFTRLLGGHRHSRCKSHPHHRLHGPYTPLYKVDTTDTSTLPLAPKGNEFPFLRASQQPKHPER